MTISAPLDQQDTLLSEGKPCEMHETKEERRPLGASAFPSERPRQDATGTYPEVGVSVRESAPPRALRSWFARLFAAPVEPDVYIPRCPQDRPAAPSWSTTLAGWK